VAGSPASEAEPSGVAQRSEPGGVGVSFGAIKDFGSSSGTGRKFPNIFKVKLILHASKGGCSSGIFDFSVPYLVWSPEAEDLHGHVVEVILDPLDKVSRDIVKVSAFG
jgi:hypothetical protein